MAAGSQSASRFCTVATDPLPPTFSEFALIIARECDPPHARYLSKTPKRHIKVYVADPDAEFSIRDDACHREIVDCVNAGC